jgi:small-conductance mechanosensitive channel
MNLAATRTPGIRKEPRPVVLQLALSDFYVEYELQVRLERVEDRIRILSDLNAQILDVFNEYGVQIMSPHFNRQPEQAVVVEKDLWHASPAVDPSDGEKNP